VTDSGRAVVGDLGAVPGRLAVATGLELDQVVEATVRVPAALAVRADDLDPDLALPARASAAIPGDVGAAVEVGALRSGRRDRETAEVSRCHQAVG
jgi:hypothetical protein